MGTEEMSTTITINFSDHYEKLVSDWLIIYLAVIDR